MKLRSLGFLRQVITKTRGIRRDILSVRDLETDGENINMRVSERDGEKVDDKAGERERKKSGRCRR